MEQEKQEHTEITEKPATQRIILNKCDAMPKYKCHKEVMAMKIVSIVELPEAAGGFALHVDNPLFRPVEVTAAWMGRHSPHTGGYWVKYPDGYESFSPAEAFESGYTLIESENHPPLRQRALI